MQSHDAEFSDHGRTPPAKDKRAQVFIISSKTGIEKVVWDKDSAIVTLRLLKGEGKYAWWEEHTVVGGSVSFVSPVVQPESQTLNTEIRNRLRDVKCTVDSLWDELRSGDDPDAIDL